MKDIIDIIEKSPIIHDKNIDSDNTGELMFSPHHVWATNSMFGQLVRMIFCEEKITLRMFRRAVLKTYLEHGKPQKIATSQQSNLLKAITRPRPTIYKFKEIICGILGYDIDITISLTKNGKTSHYSYRNLIKKYMRIKREEERGGTIK